jgi:CspA family cold shock protein
MAYGTVKWFSDSKGFGYIVADDTREEFFAHFSEIKSLGPKVLKERQRVKYEKAIGGPSGKRATEIYTV